MDVYKILLSYPWTILWLITVQVTEFDPCFASSLHHWLWVHQNSQLYFTVLDVTFDFVLKLVLALFLEEQKTPKNNLYRPLTKIYGTNKHNKSGFKIKKIITYMSKVNLELTVCLLNRSVKTFLLFWTWSLSCILFCSF